MSHYLCFLLKFVGPSPGNTQSHGDSLLFYLCFFSRKLCVQKEEKFLPVLIHQEVICLADRYVVFYSEISRFLSLISDYPESTSYMLSSIIMPSEPSEWLSQIVLKGKVKRKRKYLQMQVRADIKLQKFSSGLFSRFLIGCLWSQPSFKFLSYPDVYPHLLREKLFEYEE